MNLYSRGRVLKIASFEGPMILRVGKYIIPVPWILWGLSFPNPLLELYEFVDGNGSSAETI